MEKRNLNFPKALEWVANKCGIEKSQLQENIKYPFGGFYKKLAKEVQEPEFSIKTYDESILNEYLNSYSKMFLDDGINFDVQEEFKVGYDLLSNRITIPIWSLDNKLMGIMGRLNDLHCLHEERWLPIIPCSRSLTLYGYIQNYSKIQEKGFCIVGESEKYVQQLKSFGCDIGLTTSGCRISDTQAKYLKSLLVPKIIIAYDEGLEEEFVIEQAKKIKVETSIFQNQVGYIWDSDNEILEKGKKQSPSDLGKEKFSYLLKNKIKWI
jgi:DNA primase